MGSATLTLLAAGLLLAWVFGPLIIIQYRTTIVPKRYQEIADRFLSHPEPGALVPADDRGKSGAWHYARMLDPNANAGHPEAVLKAQFLHFQGWKRYALPLILLLLLSGLMLAFSGLWIADILSPAKPNRFLTNNSETNSAGSLTTGGTNTFRMTEKPVNSATPSFAETSLLSGIKPPLMMALWGAFVWSLYEILNRRRSGDLTPLEVYDVAFRFVTAVPVGYAFSALALNTVPSFVAFAVSALPFRDLRQLVRRQSLQRLGESPQASSSLSSKGYISETISGMGNDTIARLEDLNVETYLDLAYTDPIKLMIKMGAPIQLVLAWIDQALLAVYAAPHVSKLEQLGMPCALDACEFYVRHCFDIATGKAKDWENDQSVKDLAAALNIPVGLLVEHLLKGIFEDPQCQFLIRAWYGPAKSPDSL